MGVCKQSMVNTVFNTGIQSGIQLVLIDKYSACIRIIWQVQITMRGMHLYTPSFDCISVILFNL